MLAGCDDVVTIHGCDVKGEVVLISGLDNALATELQTSSEYGVFTECHMDAVSGG
jgi:hypothetical protein